MVTGLSPVSSIDIFSIPQDFRFLNTIQLTQAYSSQQGKDRVLFRVTACQDITTRRHVREPRTSGNSLRSWSRCWRISCVFTYANFPVCVHRRQIGSAVRTPTFSSNACALFSTFCLRRPLFSLSLLFPGESGEKIMEHILEGVWNGHDSKEPR